MHKRSPIKPLPALERRIPRSAKYAHIESKLDTGLTINKVKVVTAKEYRMRRDEIFFRISCDQLYDLYNEYEADERETIGETLYNSSRGGPKIVTYSEESKPEYIKPYLILDVREVHDYNSCHLLHAKSYPYTLIRRDYLLPEIYTFKNKEETLIILYCDDERISRDTAKTLVDRGIDNVFLLEGGLKEFCGLYPAFVEGNIPFPVQINRKSSTSSTPSSSLTRSKVSALPDERKSSISSSKFSSGRQYSPSASVRSNSTSRYTTMKSRMNQDDRSVSGFSGMSNKSVAESVISRSVSRKGRF